MQRVETGVLLIGFFLFLNVLIYGKSMSRMKRYVDVDSRENNGVNKQTGKLMLSVKPNYTLFIRSDP